MGVDKGDTAPFTKTQTATTLDFPQTFDKLKLL